MRRDVFEGDTYAQVGGAIHVNLNAGLRAGLSSAYATSTGLRPNIAEMLHCVASAAQAGCSVPTAQNTEFVP
jgi:hypothetical protein